MADESPGGPLCPACWVLQQMHLPLLSVLLRLIDSRPLPCPVVLVLHVPVPVVVLLRFHPLVVLLPPRAFPDLQVRSYEIVTQPPDNRLSVLVHCGDLSSWSPLDSHLHHIHSIPLVHGSPSSTLFVLDLAPFLTKYHSVVALANSGHGR